MEKPFGLKRLIICIYRKLTEKPHLAGTEEETELAQYLSKVWTDQGLDHVTLTPYRVMLSYPNESDPNFVELLDANGTMKYRSYEREPILTPEENKTGVVPPFNAYSAKGDITVCLYFGKHFLISNDKVDVQSKKYNFLSKRLSVFLYNVLI